jgi:hypothetical protein
LVAPFSVRVQKEEEVSFSAQVREEVTLVLCAEPLEGVAVVVLLCAVHYQVEVVVVFCDADLEEVRWQAVGMVYVDEDRPQLADEYQVLKVQLEYDVAALVVVVVVSVFAAQVVNGGELLGENDGVKRKHDDVQKVTFLVDL